VIEFEWLEPPAPAWDTTRQGKGTSIGEGSIIFHFSRFSCLLMIFMTTLFHHENEKNKDILLFWATDSVFLGRRQAIWRTTALRMLVGRGTQGSRHKSGRPFWSGCLTTHQAAGILCRLDTHSDKLARQRSDLQNKLNHLHILRGPFSGVSKPIFASKYSLESSWREL
jgi:hypothetical protein